jgi:hypothetical protein
MPEKYEELELDYATEHIEGLKPRVTKNYKRYRIRNPKLFKKGSFRTLDIGKPKRHLLVRGLLKSTGTWKTQSVLVEKKLSDGMTKSIIQKAKKY